MCLLLSRHARRPACIHSSPRLARLSYLQVIDHSQAECSSPTGDVIRSFENVANFISASQVRLYACGGLFMCHMWGLAEPALVPACLCHLQPF